MRVRELRMALEKMDGNAFVVINNQIVADVLAIKGRVGDGVKRWPDEFRRVENGCDSAVTFLCHTEFSDGTQGLSSIFA